MASNDSYINWILQDDPEDNPQLPNQQSSQTFQNSAIIIPSENPPSLTIPSDLSTEDLFTYLDDQTDPNFPTHFTENPQLQQTYTSIPDTIGSYTIPVCDSASLDQYTPLPIKACEHEAKGSSSPSDEDEPTPSQWKMMTSKERRQVRNKISARNFRNRRKEYITTLENKVEQYKAENSQLKLEVRWVRTTMKRIQEENDRLRVDLILLQAGIQPGNHNPGQSNSNTNNISTPWNNTNIPLQQAPLLSSPSSNGTLIQQDALTSSDDALNQWDFFLPATNTTYLSHATFPSIDLNAILSEKDRATLSTMPPSQLFTRYPLLAPALMSIVLEHTMRMNTEEFLTSSRLLLPPPPPSPITENPATKSPLFFSFTDELLFAPKFGSGLLPRPTQPTEKDIQRIWHAISSKPTTYNTIRLTAEADTTATPPQTRQSKCPLSWVQKQFCRFVINYVIVRYPQLDAQCRTYLPVCDTYRLKPITLPLTSS
ncbi:basic-leucine zipper transcription factor [Phycomyces blakesleeanus]|uniref:Basic-leucine zipper transcription factor n=2 Tax=Phycomyces blakesleeanus TaxID=4837 RepID=A0A162XX85_PHYB8|nr:basic-leucine zipper transcription factor [Phycomyces blakesleeanus NRRL 1555(-)]OAD77015.1 basic-leucine zipper transcription factor [Phycomyces blakesleeanus NRRL 1555(-)]|eukprot:XP_018295055.1 basic-leucine zipper transcription factor [Phycomyces blakesleeanus NRRL 1555(-)]